MKIIKNPFIIFIVLILLILAGYLVFRSTIPPEKEVILPPRFFEVARVIDGDTIELKNGERVRYIGIDTPESVDPRKEVECFGIEAAKKNKELVEGKAVRLDKDVSDQDQYDRLLRYVYLQPQSVYGEEVFVNLELIKQGYAQAATFPPDVKFYKTFIEAQQEARENKRGLWGGCKNDYE